MFRRLLERAVRGTVLRRTLPAGFRSQPLYVSPDARLAYLFRSLGGAERRLLEWANELVGPGEVVWDVGANCGVFGIAAAVRAGSTGSVVAVEPDPFLADLLARSRDALGARDAGFDVVRAAVAERSGTSSLHVSARGRAASWLDGSRPSTQTGGSRGRQSVEVVTLDELLRSRRPPTLVKIDVEGSEARVLTGAERLLGEVRPTLLVEVSSAVAGTVGRILEANRYQLFDARMNPADRTRLDLPAPDTLAIPGSAPADS